MINWFGNTWVKLTVLTGEEQENMTFTLKFKKKIQ